MNVLVLVHNQVNTGPYFKVLELCRALTESGNNITLVGTSQKSYFKTKKKNLNNILSIEMPDLLWGRLRQGIDIWNMLNRLFFLLKTKNNYDMIYAIDCRPVVIFPALFLKKIKKIPLVLSWWDLFGRGGTALSRSGKLYYYTFGFIETFLEEYFRKFADYSTVVSRELMDRLVELNYPADKIAILKVGSSQVDKPDKICSKIELRKKLGFSDSEKIFVFVGTLFDDDKEFLIDSLRELKKNLNVNPRTILVGNHTLEQELIADLNIRITGRLKTFDEVGTYLIISDFALIPMKCSLANMARWPSKISDYLAFNLPIISTPISDLEEINKKYNIGLISRSDSSKDFSAAMQKALGIPNEEYKHYTCSAAKLFEEEISWEIISKKMNKIFTEAI